MSHRYSLQCVVGEGAFATVSKCVFGSTGKPVAVKRFRKKYADWKSACGIPEITTLLAMRGYPNIAQILELVRETDGTVFFAMDLEDGSLLDFLKDRKSLDEALTRILLRQVLTGLSALHSHGYVHRDVKPENILVSLRSTQHTIDLHVVVADLGSTMQVGSNASTDYVTTRYYRSPEMVFKSSYDQKVDIWAAGCVAFEVLTGNVLFPAHSEADLVLRMCSVLGSPPMDDARFRSMAEQIALNPGLVPMKFSKQSLKRWFQGSYNDKPTYEVLNLLEKMIQWIPESRVDTLTALRMDPFLL